MHIPMKSATGGSQQDVTASKRFPPARGYRQQKWQPAKTYLGVVGAADKQCAIRRVGHGGHIVVVPLLLQHVRLRAPIPHQQLPQLGARQRHLAGRTAISGI